MRWASKVAKVGTDGGATFWWPICWRGVGREAPSDGVGREAVRVMVLEGTVVVVVSIGAMGIQHAKEGGST